MRDHSYQWWASSKTTEIPQEENKETNVNTEEQTLETKEEEND